MKTKIIGLIVVLIIAIGFVVFSQPQKTVYVCDYSKANPEFKSVIVSIELYSKGEELIAEKSTHTYTYFDHTSSYMKDYLSQNFNVNDSDGIKTSITKEEDALIMTYDIDYLNINEAEHDFLYDGQDIITIQAAKNNLEEDLCTVAN